MANPPKKKGTGGETELADILRGWGMVVDRTQPGANYDLRARWPGADEKTSPLNVLATRPDRGEWLFTLRPRDVAGQNRPLAMRVWHVEVKRYARFSHHAIFHKKFDLIET